MTKRHREGTLISTVLDEPGSDDIDDGAYGVILGVPDFLDKAERLAKELLAGPRSVRRQWAALLQHSIRLLRADLRADRVSEDALLHMMDAAFWYRSLLFELSTDVPSKKAGLTRGEYLEFRDKAISRSDLAELCGLKTVFALTRWETDHSLPHVKYPRRKRATTKV
jgi:hypothetical protein